MYNIYKDTSEGGTVCVIDLREHEQSQLGVQLTGRQEIKSDYACKL